MKVCLDSFVMDILTSENPLENIQYNRTSLKQNNSSCLSFLLSGVKVNGSSYRAMQAKSLIVRYNCIYQKLISRPILGTTWKKETCKLHVSRCQPAGWWTERLRDSLASWHCHAAVSVMVRQFLSKVGGHDPPKSCKKAGVEVSGALGSMGSSLTRPRAQRSSSFTKENGET